MLSFAHEVYGQIALSRGVEPRSPLSDRRMLEFAIRMPVQAKLGAPWYKHLMRISMAGILPEAVRWRQDVGNHPGWKFHEQLIRALARDRPDIWNPGHIAQRAGPLGRRGPRGAGLAALRTRCRPCHRYEHPHACDSMRVDAGPEPGHLSRYRYPAEQVMSSKPQPPGNARKAYTPPTLVTYGKVQALTQSGTRGSRESAMKPGPSYRA